MRRNLSKRIAVVLLVLFTCAFTVQNLAAVNRNFKIELSTLFSGKVFKTVPTSPDCPVDEESLCEEETEDESETQFNPLALLSVIYCEIFALETSRAYAHLSDHSAERQEVAQPLFVATHTFRI